MCIQKKPQYISVCNHTNITMKNAKKQNNHVNSRPEVSQVSWFWTDFKGLDICYSIG